MKEARNACGDRPASGSLVAYSPIGMGAFAVFFAGEMLGGLWLVFIGWLLLSAARATAGQVVLERILEGVRMRPGSGRAPTRL